MKKFCVLAICMVITACLLCGCGTNPGGGGFGKSEFASGSGTESDPYVIDKAYQWNNISKHLDAYYKLDEDLNLGDYSLAPIGSDMEPFTGYLDGQNHKVFGATISGRGKSGLFGVVSGATIKNLKFSDSQVTLIDYEDGDGLGSFVGQAKTGATIENCHVSSVNVKYNCGDWDDHYIGGFAGKVSSAAELIYCSSNVIISTNSSGKTYYPNFYLGGLVGSVNGGNIKLCWAAGTVDTTKGASSSYAAMAIGGIVGVFSGGSITDVYSECNFVGTPRHSGTIGYYSSNASFVEYGFSFCEFSSTPSKTYYTMKIEANGYTAYYYGPSIIASSNSILDSEEWANRPWWKKGKIHPVFVSYEEYLELENAED